MPNSVEKFAMIAYIAKANAGNGPLGKKAFQKLVHIASDLFDMELGYKFRLYTYGPFSRELAGDIDLLDTMGLLSVNFDPKRNGYEIKPAKIADSVIEANESFLSGVKGNLDFVLGKFGGKLAKELELYSMVLFIFKNGMADLTSDSGIADKFLEIKPHYSRDEVMAGISEIRKLLMQ